MKKFCALLMMAATLFCASAAMAAEKLTVYTSMKDSLIGELKDAFLKKNPDIQFDAYVAGAGKLMAKIAAERQSGAMVADVLWHSEVPDFYQLKEQGVLEAYKSPEAKFVDSPVEDPDGYFTPARNGTLGIIYNTRFIKEAPKTWKDVLGPDYKDAFGVADPALSGTAYGSAAALVNLYGWDYFKDMQKNGGIMSQGSGQVVDDTAMGDLVACIGVDYPGRRRHGDGRPRGLHRRRLHSDGEDREGRYARYSLPERDRRAPQPDSHHQGNEEPLRGSEVCRLRAF